MNYLIALLAFSAIMIVLSTLASVLVESLHRLFNTRSRDFDEMLTQLYLQSVRPHLKNAGVELAEKAESFVREIRQNPAISSRRNGLFNRFLVKTEFEELTTRQFVEQFAQSEAGQKLMQKVSDNERDLAASTIAKLSYEFERYGQAATEYFKRRAGFLSILVAFVLASSLNIDALNLYQALSKNTKLAEQVVESIDVEKLQKARAGDLAVVADDVAARQAINTKYDEILDSYREASGQLEGLNLPVGRDYFPFCAKGSALDSRCALIKSVEKVHLLPLVDPALSWLKRFTLGVGAVLSSEDGLVWLFRIIVTTGLIGLGAPFWYNTYRSVGQLIPGRRQPPSETTAERNQSLAATATPASTPVIVTVPAPVDEGAVAAGDDKADDAVSTRSLAPARRRRKESVAVAESKPTVVRTVAAPVPVQTDVGKGLLKEDLLNIFTNTATAKTVKEEDNLP